MSVASACVHHGVTLLSNSMSVATISDLSICRLDSVNPNNNDDLIAYHTEAINKQMTDGYTALGKFSSRILKYLAE